MDGTDEDGIITLTKDELLIFGSTLSPKREADIKEKKISELKKNYWI